MDDVILCEITKKATRIFFTLPRVKWMNTTLTRAAFTQLEFIFAKVCGIFLLREGSNLLSNYFILWFIKLYLPSLYLLPATVK